MLLMDDVLGDRFRVERELGRGGMGVVLKAHDTLLDRAVAIKMISKELAEGGGLKGHQIIQRFLIEARAAAKLAHPNVVTLYDVVDAKPPYIVMEFVDGVTLRDMVERQGPLQLEEACAVCAQVARGLAAAHAQGMIHRDIKPENVIIAGDKAKILDFGLAQLHQLKKATSDEPVLGTPGYMAPEQILGKEATAASDVFATACVFVFALTGRDLFEGADVREILTKVVKEDPDLSQLPVGASLRPVITRSLSKQPEERPTAEELAEAFELGRSESPDRYADFFDSAAAGNLQDAVSVPGLAPVSEPSTVAAEGQSSVAAQDVGATIRLTVPPGGSPTPGGIPGTLSTTGSARATAPPRPTTGPQFGARSTGTHTTVPSPPQRAAGASDGLPKGVVIAAIAVAFVLAAFGLLWLISSVVG